jgi:hypothetical protein
LLLEVLEAFLGLYGLDQPCATQELRVAMLEGLKEEDVDRNVFVVEVADDAFGAGIEFGRAENDLVRLVEEVFIQVFAEAFFERAIMALTQSKGARGYVSDLPYGAALLDLLSGT